MADEYCGVKFDEHRKHIDNAAYQAAIERAAIAGTGEPTKEIERNTIKPDGTPIKEGAK